MTVQVAVMSSPSSRHETLPQQPHARATYTGNDPQLMDTDFEPTCARHVVSVDAARAELGPWEFQRPTD